MIEVQKSLSGQSNRVLSMAMTRDMLTPVSNNQGLGPQTGGSADHPYFTHGGSDAGFQSYFVAYNTGDGAVILTNGNNGGLLAEEILRAIAQVYNWPDFQPIERTVQEVQPRVLALYTGNYELQPAPGTLFTINLEDNKLFQQPQGGPKSQLLPTGLGEFFVKGLHFLITFDTDGQREPTQFSYWQSGTEVIAKRTPVR
jgi:hypothetical protein